ncbi:MAG: hypothetical protein ACLGI3_04500 [Actinomycetes bacterium]
MAAEFGRSLGYEQLRSGIRPSGRLLLEGAAVVRSLDLSGWRVRELVMSDATGLADEMLPRPVKPARVGRRIPAFVDCDFSGLRCRRFDPGIVRFVRCRFADVDVEASLGATRAHFRDCVFSGRWEGNFDARPAGRDPARRVAVEGNSFVGCTGFGIQGGIDRWANAFDPELHVVLQRNGPGWDEVRRLAATDRHLGHVVTSLEGRGPFDIGQDWTVLSRLDEPEDLWSQLRRATGSRTGGAGDR